MELDAAGEPETLNMMALGDRILRRYPFEVVIQILCAIAEFWTELFLKVQPDAVVGEVACAAEWMAWRFASRAGIPYLIPYCASAEKRFFFLDAPGGIWESMERRYHEAKERELSADQKREAEKFLFHFRSKRPKPLMGGDDPLRPNFPKLLQRLTRVPFRIRTYLEDGKFEVGSYHGTPPWEPLWNDMQRIVRHAICETSLFDAKPVGGPAVYFPLHMEPEFTTDVRAPFHTNQLAVIENVCKSVPIRYRVLVKEHPVMAGERPLRYYRDLKRFYNVQLLSPAVESHGLIERAQAILTITGSSAWEAILYEKPAIAFGPLCYGFYDLLYHCENPADLPAVLREALTRFRPDHDLLLKFVWAFLDSAYELEWGDPIRCSSVLERENIERTANAIVAEIVSRAPERSAETIPT
jgi:hypothetical protein